MYSDGRLTRDLCLALLAGSKVGNEGMRGLYIPFKGLYRALIPHSLLRTRGSCLFESLRGASILRWS